MMIVLNPVEYLSVLADPDDCVFLLTIMNPVSTTSRHARAETVGPMFWRYIFSVVLLPAQVKLIIDVACLGYQLVITDCVYLRCDLSKAKFG